MHAAEPIAQRAEAPSESWSQYLMLAVVILAAFVFYVTHQTPGVAAEDTDWAMYVMHARNLAEGRPYMATGYVHQPESVTEVGALSLPSGLPLLLAPIYASTGADLRVFKLLNAALLALSIWPAYLLLRRAGSTRQALLCCGVIAFSYFFLITYNAIGTDAPYLLCTLVALSIAMSITANARDRSAPWRWGIVTGVAIAIASLFRPFALALLLGIVAAELIRHRTVTHYALATVAGFVPLAVVNALALHNDFADASQWTVAPGAVVHHAVDYLKLLSNLFANPLSHLFRYGMFALALPLAAYGVWLRVQRGVTVLETYVVLLGALLCLSSSENLRYLMPLLPLIFLYLLEARREFTSRLGRFGQQASVVAGAALLVAPTANALRMRPDTSDSLVTAPAFEALSDTVTRGTARSAYVVFRNPRVLSLWSARASSGWPRVDESTAFATWLQRIGADYVVVDLQDQRERDAAAALVPSHAKVWYENARYRVLALGKRAAP